MTRQAEGAPAAVPLRIAAPPRARHARAGLARAERVPAAWRAPTWAQQATLLLVGLGLLVRARQWAGGRSLWLDEALIARSLVERGHVSLATEPLLHNQAAPQGWLQAVRLSVDVLGDGERSLRLVSLLAGCATLLLLWRLASRLLPPALVPVAVGVAALHPGLVYYANEVKPYALDVLAVLAVVAVALHRRPLELGLVGAVAVWCAYPAVFVLTGASVVLVLRATSRRQAVRTALHLSPWLISLGVAYVLVLAPLRGREVYEEYWAYAYPRGATDLPAWLGRRTADLLHDPLALGVAPLALALLALGAARLLRRRGGGLLLTAVPPAVVAGAASAYPLADRLALWLVPLAALVLAAALDLPRRAAVAAAVALAVVAGPTAVGTLPDLVRTREVEELGPVLERLEQLRRPGDLVLVDIAAKAAFDHYAPRRGVPRDGVVLFRTPEPGTDCGADVVALRTGRFGNGRVWLVLSHELVDNPLLGTRADLLARIGRVTRLAGTIEDTGAQALLLSPAPTGQALPGAPRTPERCLVVNRSAR